MGSVLFVFAIRALTSIKCSSAFWSVIHTEYVLWTYAGQMLTFKEEFWVLVSLPKRGFVWKWNFLGSWLGSFTFRDSAQRSLFPLLSKWLRIVFSQVSLDGGFLVESQTLVAL